MSTKVIQEHRNVEITDGASIFRRTPLGTSLLQRRQSNHTLPYFGRQALLLDLLCTYCVLAAWGFSCPSSSMLCLVYCAWPFQWVLEIKLISSCFHGRHFTEYPPPWPLLAEFQFWLTLLLNNSVAYNAFHFLNKLVRIYTSVLMSSWWNTAFFFFAIFLLDSRHIYSLSLR